MAIFHSDQAPAPAAPGDGAGSPDRRPGTAAFRPGSGEEQYDIRIARDGTWFHEGAPIRRPALVKLLASALRRDEAGDYWLITPAERGRLVVEDAPFTAVSVTCLGEGESQVLRFATNLDHVVEAGPDHPIRVDFAPGTGEPRPYVRVTAGSNGLDALVLRPVYYELAERAVERNGRLGVWSKGIFFPLDERR